MNILHQVAIISLIIAGLSFVIILIDILSGNRQKMMIMNFVYPLTALYASIFAIIFYFRIGRKAVLKTETTHGKAQMHSNKKPFWQSVATGALHCGSGCTLGDILAEFMLLFLPAVLFGSRLLGSWAVEFVFAFVIGIIFQYYSIKPMRKLGVKEALIAALKADTLSLTAWQIGMYGWMAIAMFLIFKVKLEATNPLFWFMMQIAMLFGFATAYPVNWWLIKKGIKEEM